MKLWREGTELQDASKLADAQVENDDVLALAFRVAGEVAASEQTTATLRSAVLEPNKMQATQAFLGSQLA